MLEVFGGFLYVFSNSLIINQLTWKLLNGVGFSLTFLPLMDEIDEKICKVE